MKRTGSIGSRVPPAVTTTRSPVRSWSCSAVSSPSTARDDRLGLGQAAGADVAAGQAAALGLDDVDAARRAAARRLSCTDGVLPHLGVHGRAHQHRGPGGEQDVGEQVVADARRRRGPSTRAVAGATSTRSAVWPRWVCGIGWGSSHSDVHARSEPRASKVVRPTKWSAPSVRTGTTWAPASTRRRHSSTAL